MHAKVANNAADALIARLAARQHGVVSLHQLEGAGIHRQGRVTRLRAGSLHRIHRGVFAVGHPGLSEEGRWMAAVLACGRGAALSQSNPAALSRGSAAALWKFLPSPSLIHVIVPGDGGRAHHRGVRVHRSVTLDPGEITRRLGIPVTTPSRTLADLRRTLPRERYEAALREAEFLGLPIDHELGPDRTRSELEGRFLAFCRRRRLPAPRVNARIGRYVVDFAWLERRLLVELDGYRAHRTRSAFEADRERDSELKLLGYDVIRITRRRLTDEPADVAATLRALLQQRR